MKINLYNSRPFPEETHRWGWNGVSDILLKHFHDDNAPVMLDAMIEHTFKVGKSKGMDFRHFPHAKQKWISIFHSPSTSLGSMTSGWEQNVFTLYADKHYRAFMENCIGMITLSKSFALKTQIALGNMGIKHSDRLYSLSPPQKLFELFNGELSPTGDPYWILDEKF